MRDGEEKEAITGEKHHSLIRHVFQLITRRVEKRRKDCNNKTRNLWDKNTSTPIKRRILRVGKKASENTIGLIEL